MLNNNINVFLVLIFAYQYLFLSPPNMKKLFPTLLVFFCLSFASNAQLLWQKTYGSTNRNVFLTRMIPLQNGGYLLAGSQSLSPANMVGYLVRTNASGDTLWTRHHKPVGFDRARIYDAAEDGDGNLLIVGSGFNNLNGQDYNGFILKLNPNGDTIWTRRTITPKSDGYTSCIIANDGNYLIVGEKNQINQIQKVGKNGLPIWIKAMQFSIADTGVISAIHPAPNGYSVFISTFNGFPLPNKVFRIDEAGNPLFNFTNYAWGATDIFTEAGNNLLVAASSKLFKLNPLGDTIWSRLYMKNGQYLGINAVKTTNDGNYILGFDRLNGMDSDVGLMKTTINGDLIKDTVLFRFGNSEFLKDLVVDAGGDYVFSGHATINSMTNSQFFLAKHRKWNRTLGLKEDNAFAKGLKLYPNPALEQIMLESEKLLTGSLTLINLQGQQVWHETVSGMAKKVLPLHRFPPGIYILRFAGDDGEQFSRKLIKR
jgi:hypothetical protein